jgi:hypothetical protein
LKVYCTNVPDRLNFLVAGRRYKVTRLAIGDKMNKKNDRIVFKRDDGWVNKSLSAQRAASISPTQHAAEKEARAMLQKQGGGELIIKGRDGKIRSKDTIPPGNDPNPPRDKEH